MGRRTVTVSADVGVMYASLLVSNLLMAKGAPAVVSYVCASSFLSGKQKQRPRMLGKCPFMLLLIFSGIGFPGVPLYFCCLSMELNEVGLE